jgi:aldose 1-epimerase
MLTLVNECHVIAIDPASGGRMTSWRMFGHELLTGVDDHPIQYGMYPMAPWAGRLRANTYADHPMPANWDGWAIHGAFLTSNFSVVESAGDVVVLQAHAVVAERRVQCSLTYRLRGSDLETTIEVDVDEGELPVLLGWHPWFRRDIAGNVARWSAAGAVMIAREPDGLPGNERIPLTELSGPFDDVFSVPSGEVLMDWGVMQLQIANSHPWYVIFDELESAVCLEPQTGPPNCTSGSVGVSIAQPESPVRMHTRWRATSHPS